MWHVHYTTHKKQNRMKEPKENEHEDSHCSLVFVVRSIFVDTLLFFAYPWLGRKWYRLEANTAMLVRLYFIA